MRDARSGCIVVPIVATLNQVVIAHPQAVDVHSFSESCAVEPQVAGTLRRSGCILSTYIEPK
jgi:hypothetical protein